MIILDTNVISTMMRRVPDAEVLTWLDEQPPESIWTTSVTVFEIEFGLALLPKSRRRTQLETAFGAMLAEDLDGRVLSFDEEAGRRAAGMAAKARQAGRSIEIRDVEIAGIAAARRASLATRNTRHFEALGIRLVDPWNA